MFKGVGDDGYLKAVGGRVANGKGYTIDGNRAFIYCKIAIESHFLVFLVFKSKIGRAVGVLFCDAHSGLIDVSLYNMSVETSVQHHRSFHIDFVAYVK